ncbi:MAG: electron transfer flavoprotein subunit beta/FixA family protein [Clostridia bacterium]|nr:electron transfer flavoprotein subunit beta/FixA family protein [Deltaproteobacteria bacterium]
MKILVTVKRVEDWEVKIKVKPDGSGIVTDQMKYVVNPFDEIAVEEALRVRDAAGSGEVIVATIGVADAQQQLRTALAMGADRGVHVVADIAADSTIIAKALKKVVESEKPDLVILGKQAVDDDQGQVGGMLAELLGWGQATFASKEESLESEAEKTKQAALKVKDGRIEVVREIDGGLERVSLALPVVVTTELRLNVPRYASLPGIMKAKKKPVQELKLSELAAGSEARVKVVKLEPPKERKAGIKVPDVATLFDKMHNEAKVV